MATTRPWRESNSCDGVTLFDTEELESAAPDGPLTRVRMTVAYDGTGYHGFAAQPGVKTVAGAIGDAAARVLGHPVSLTCAGRTDAGVHAAGQVVHFDSTLTEEQLDLPTLQRSLNKMLKSSIVVRDARVASDEFDARHSAIARSYRYTILNRYVPDPFLAHYSWLVEEALDVRAMQAACDPFIGEHDFTSFCKKPGVDDASLVRRVIDARWVALGEGVLRFDVSATSFCQQMVRSIVGTLVEVGLGKKRAGDISWIIRGKDRSLAGQVAPPAGLCLWDVVYPPELS